MSGIVSETQLFFFLEEGEGGVVADVEVVGGYAGE